MSWQLFDRIGSYFKKMKVYRAENIFTDQSSLMRIIAGNDFINFSSQNSLLQQTNLQINRLERYKDFDQMDEIGEITLALDMYSDEGSLIDPERKHSLMVRAKRNRVKEELEDLFYNTLLIDNFLRPAIRYLCKYGDFPLEIIPTKHRDGVQSIRHMNIYNFTRVETKFGDLVGFFYQDELSQQPTFFHPWQIAHLRLTSFENIYHPYGRAVLDGARKHFKQLRLMEDAALVYRITRAPEKRVFTIPVGNIPTKDVPQYMELIAREFKKKKFFDPSSGDVNERWHPLIQEDDFWMPQRCVGAATKVPIIDEYFDVGKDMIQASKNIQNYDIFNSLIPSNSSQGATILSSSQTIPHLSSNDYTVEELVKKYGHMDKEFWVYSYKDGKIIPAKAKACISPKNQQMARVTLDNGESIECTLDHKFMMRNESWIEAQDLKPGDSLMPLYRRKKIYYGQSDYEQVKHPDSGWEWTHKVVCPECPKNHVRHHKELRDELEKLHNHKVLSVEFLEEKQDTYCLVVPDTKCFFVSAGVLIHNSDGNGPTVDTLPGAENLDQIADIEYFKKKMISALKIPFSRVGIGEPDESSRESLSKSAPEFAKAIQWIQREVSIALKKIAMVHLALRGYTADDMRNFDLIMTASSAIDELYRMEVWASRADVIEALKSTELFPDHWILRRFTDMTDDEIDQMIEDKEMRDQEMLHAGNELGIGGPPGAAPGGAGVAPPMGGAPPLPALEGFDIDLEQIVLSEFRNRKKRQRRRKFLVKEEYFSGFDSLMNNGEFDALPYDKDEHGNDVIVESVIPKDERSIVIKENMRLLLNESIVLSDDDEVKMSDLPS